MNHCDRTCEQTRERMGIAARRAARLLLAAMLLAPIGCDGGAPISPGPLGDCVSLDETVVRQNVTQEQCAAICPACSWVSNSES